MHRLPGTGTATVGVRTFAYTFVPPALVMAGVVIAKALFDVPVERLTTEATTITQVPPYVGAVSAIGCFGWAAAVGMFLMGACLLYDWLERREAAFLACSALLTAYLCVDDAFTLHEAVLPAVGIPERATYAAIGLATLAYGWFFRREIRRSAWIFLVIAVGFLGLSVVIDEVGQAGILERLAGVAMVGEDGAKLMGISAWVCYAALSTRGLVTSRFTAPLRRAPLSPTRRR